MSETARKQRYPFLKGHDLSGVVAEPASAGPRGSSNVPGSGALYTYDMIATIDGEWLVRNAPKVMDAAAQAANLEFHRGTEEFLAIVEEIGTPDLERRELFRGVFDGRYKLVRYFGLRHYNLPESVAELLADNDVALYDTRLDPEEMNNLADPKNPQYDEALLATMNAKLTALIKSEIGEDSALFPIAS
jgi:arylsulfatase